MITKMKQILGAAAAMLMLAACGSPKTNLPLEGTQWKLTERTYQQALDTGI